MSPIDPISPTSPLAFDSQASPTDVGYTNDFILQPLTPTISPFLHLPRLVTSFTSRMNKTNANRLSLQSLLSTPSPFSLETLPITAMETSEWITVGEPIKSASSHYSNSMSSLSQKVCETTSSGVNYIPPKLQRQNAMDGLDDMILDTPTELESQTESSFGNPSYESTSDTRTAQTSTSRNSKYFRRRRVSQNQCKSKTRPQPKTPVLIVQNTPAIQASLEHLRTPLVPLISVRTGLAHPDFPLSLLQYHLLTHNQLDNLARWYHQTPDAGEERLMYPAPIEETKLWTCSNNDPSCSVTRIVSLDAKRRRWGRFIGLRGCESPQGQDVQENGEEEDVTALMERQWREALRRAEEEYKVREKLGRDRF